LERFKGVYGGFGTLPPGCNTLHINLLQLKGSKGTYFKKSREKKKTVIP